MSRNSLAGWVAASRTTTAELSVVATISVVNPGQRRVRIDEPFLGTVQHRQRGHHLGHRPDPETGLLRQRGTRPQYAHHNHVLPTTGGSEMRYIKT